MRFTCHSPFNSRHGVTLIEVVVVSFALVVLFGAIGSLSRLLFNNSGTLNAQRDFQNLMQITRLTLHDKTHCQAALRFPLLQSAITPPVPPAPVPTSPSPLASVTLTLANSTVLTAGMQFGQITVTSVTIASMVPVTPASPPSVSTSYFTTLTVTASASGQPIPLTGAVYFQLSMTPSVPGFILGCQKMGLFSVTGTGSVSCPWPAKVISCSPICSAAGGLKACGIQPPPLGTDPNNPSYTNQCTSNCSGVSGACTSNEVWALCSYS